MEKLTRRSFFRLAGGGIAGAVIAPKLLLDKVINIPVEFGWTWFVDKSKLEPSLGEIVSQTLRENTKKIADNITANNTLLAKLKDGTKVQLNIEKISEELQNKRIIERYNSKILEREKARVEKVIKEKNLSEVNAEYIRQRS